MKGEQNNIGGITGYSSENISECQSEVKVIGLNQVGGLIGYLEVNNKNVTIYNSSAKGDVQGLTNVGGLIGSSFEYHTNTSASVTYNLYIQKCYANRKCYSYRR